jgi:hypothetical protein
MDGRSSTAHDVLTVPFLSLSRLICSRSISLSFSTGYPQIVIRHAATIARRLKCENCNPHRRSTPARIRACIDVLTVSAFTPDYGRSPPTDTRRFA